MTSGISEDDFADIVEERLHEDFGEDNVEREYYMDETGRFVDFKVEYSGITLMIEVENEFEDIHTGVGQSIGYRSNRENTIGVVVIPEAEEEQPELSNIRKEVPIIQMKLDE